MTVSSEMLALGTKRSVIREIFEFGKKRKAEVGAENVFDFSLGNPSVEAPAVVNETIADLIKNTDSVLLHGYTSAQGDLSVRKAIAAYIKSTHGFDMNADKLYMTVGAAASLCITLRALNSGNDEFVAFAPFFPEYKVFAEAAGGKFSVVSPDYNAFQINFDELSRIINPNVKAVIVNSPNNPSGAVYSEATLRKLAVFLTEKAEEYRHPIYIICDEPYRELVYDGIEVPYVPNIYKNTIVCYSYSKSLSLPGERIGYIAVSPDMDGADDIYFSVCGAGRALGYVCASSMYQLVAARCVGKTADISIYNRNRELLYNSLTEYGYDCVHPDGAFYLFIKALEDDAVAFCERAKKYDLLLVPGDDFGCKGYVRIAYCVQTEQVERSLPAFSKLAKEYAKK